MHCSFHLNRSAAEARTARRHVADTLRGVDDDVVQTAQLLASELVSNALDHAAGAITLSIVVEADEVRVEVTDHAEGSPIVRDLDLEDEHGRGMLIVDALASAWGVGCYPRGRGKYVWFTLATA